MGPIELSPVCDIATSINRGSVSVDTHFDNRLGVSVGILYRNGVNIYIPPMRSGAIATGYFEIYLSYRCTGKALLNQFAGFMERHPNFVKVDQENGLNDTTLKLVYRIPKADLVGTDVFYVDELDLTIVLNPERGMPAHARDAFVELEYSKLREVLLNSPSAISIGVPYPATQVSVVLAGVGVKLPAYETKSGVFADICRFVDGEVVRESYKLDPRYVYLVNELADAEVKEIEETIANYVFVDTFSDNYYDRLGGVGIDNNRRDVGKELTNLNDAVDKVRTNQRAEELARIKHAQAMAGEGLKAISAASNLGAKILEIMP